MSLIVELSLMYFNMSLLELQPAQSAYFSWNWVIITLKHSLSINYILCYIFYGLLQLSILPYSVVICSPLFRSPRLPPSLPQSHLPSIYNSFANTLPPSPLVLNHPPTTFLYFPPSLFRHINPSSNPPPPLTTALPLANSLRSSLCLVVFSLHPPHYQTPSLSLNPPPPPLL